jgi:co-chaperonin GroES (HSP10)
MNFKPLNDRVILKEIKVKQTTQSGIILAVTESANTDMLYGKVIITGPGKVYDGLGVVPCTVKEGDIVIFRPNMAFRHSYQGQDYLIIRENEISSVVEGVEESDLPTYTENSFKAGPMQLESLL